MPLRAIIATLSLVATLPHVAAQSIEEPPFGFVVERSIGVRSIGFQTLLLVTRPDGSAEITDEFETQYEHLARPQRTFSVSAGRVRALRRALIERGAYDLPCEVGFDQQIYDGQVASFHIWDSHRQVAVSILLSDQKTALDPLLDLIERAGANDEIYALPQR